MKVEEGLCDGKVLFHSYVKKSAGEASQQQSEKEIEQELKDKRRKQQVITVHLNICCILSRLFFLFTSSSWFVVRSNWLDQNSICSN